MGLAGYDNWLEDSEIYDCKPYYKKYFGEYTCADCDNVECEYYETFHYYNIEDEE